MNLPPDCEDLDFRLWVLRQQSAADFYFYKLRICNLSCYKELGKNAQKTQELIGALEF